MQRIVKINHMIRSDVVGWDIHGSKFKPTLCVITPSAKTQNCSKTNFGRKIMSIHCVAKALLIPFDLLE